MKYWLLLGGLAGLSWACDAPQPSAENVTPPTMIGQLEQFDAALAEAVDTSVQAEIIATGFDWSEGPLWLPDQQKLIFSDVPRNTIYQWTEADGQSVYLQPSGYTGTAERGGETGSNGLVLSPGGQLVLCQHGNRQVAAMDAPLDAPRPDFVTLADRYQGQRLNSPNDAVYNQAGDLFFTDPPYGLELQMDDPAKETPFQGVYQLTTAGELILIADSLTRPNGIAFLPGDRTMIVANSDPADPAWYAFHFDEAGKVTASEPFFRVENYEASMPGLPDGLKVTRAGHVFATGPGGVWIFDAAGKPLGLLKLPEPTSNCALSPDEKMLYITNDGQVLRWRLRP